TFGAYMMIENVGLVLLHSDVRYYDWLRVGSAANVLGLHFTTVQLVALAAAALVVVLCTISRGTLFGLGAKALEADYGLAIMAGVDANRLILLASAIAGACMGVAGFLAGGETGVEASMGMGALFPAIVVGVVAGSPHPSRVASAA